MSILLHNMNILLREKTQIYFDTISIKFRNMQKNIIQYLGICKYVIKSVKNV